MSVINWFHRKEKAVNNKTNFFLKYNCSWCPCYEIRNDKPFCILMVRNINNETFKNCCSFHKIMMIDNDRQIKTNN